MFRCISGLFVLSMFNGVPQSIDSLIEPFIMPMALRLLRQIERFLGVFDQSLGFAFFSL